MAEAQEYAQKKGIDLIAMLQGTAVNTEIKEEEGDGTNNKEE